MDEHAITWVELVQLLAIFAVPVYVAVFGVAFLGLRGRARSVVASRRVVLTLLAAAVLAVPLTLAVLGGIGYLPVGMLGWLFVPRSFAVISWSALAAALLCAGAAYVYLRRP